MRMQREIRLIGAKKLYLMPAGDHADAIKKLARWYRGMGFQKLYRMQDNAGWVMAWTAPSKLKNGLQSKKR